MSIKGVRKKLKKLLSGKEEQLQSHVCCEEENIKSFEKNNSFNKNKYKSLVKTDSPPRGSFSVDVGEEKVRFYVPTSYLKHPAVRVLLEKSAEEFGFEQSGVLWIPCDAQTFQNILNMVNNKNEGSASGKPTLIYDSFSSSSPLGLNTDLGLGFELQNTNWSLVSC